MQGEQDVRCPLKFPATPSGGARLKRVRLDVPSRLGVVLPGQREVTRDCVLSLALQEELRGLLAAAAAKQEPWTGTDVAAWMMERLGRPVSYRLGWSYLVRLKHSPQAPRPRHALADTEQQATCKKTETAVEAGGERLSPRPGRVVGESRPPMNSGLA